MVYGTIRYIEVIRLEKIDFGARLMQLRNNKRVSARDMSLSLGQSPGYINNIENGVNYPSMALFFYICEYLEITPSEFFETASANPSKEKELVETAKRLNNKQLDTLISLAKELEK